jgi:hypothetical protein
MLIRRSDDAGRPLGVIGSVKAGFEIVSRRPWLVALPIGIDLLLWLAPRLSLEPEWVADAVNSYVALATAGGALDPANVSQIDQLAAFLGELLERFNLFSLVSLAPLLSVPSLTGHRTWYYRMAVASPLGERHALLLRGPGSVALSTALLPLLGLVLAFFYLISLGGPVRRLQRSRPGEPAGGSTSPAEDPFTAQDRGDRLRGYARRLGRLLLFATCLLAAAAAVIPVVGGVLAAGGTVSPGLGLVMGMLGTGLAYYIGLQLAFVVPAIVIGGRSLLPAIRESVTILYVDSGKTIWFFFAVFILYQVSGALWSLAEPESWALAASIVGNACVGTGLTAAAFVFYQERAIRLRRVRASVGRESRSSDDSEGNGEKEQE